MSRDPTVLLRHIRLCIDRIADYAKGGQAEFMAEPKTQDAIIRNLEIIGQAVRDYGIEQLEVTAPALPWQRIAGLRNVLAHQYLGVDLRLVWNIIEKERRSWEKQYLACSRRMRDACFVGATREGNSQSPQDGEVQGSRMVEPVVLRASRSACAFAASFRA